MDPSESAEEYAQQENCFVSHSQFPFDVSHQLGSLQNTAYEHHSSCLAEEHGLYSYSLPSPAINLEEPPDKYALSLKKLEDQCRQLDSLPSMLPAWNHSYQTLPLPTEFLDIDFNPELDLKEYQ